MDKGVGMRRWLVLVLILAGGCAPARESDKTATGEGAHFYFVQMNYPWVIGEGTPVNIGFPVVWSLLTC
jgi:hypothetical protein